MCSILRIRTLVEASFTCLIIAAHTEQTTAFNEVSYLQASLSVFRESTDVNLCDTFVDTWVTNWGGSPGSRCHNWDNNQSMNHGAQHCDMEWGRKECAHTCCLRAGISSSLVSALPLFSWRSPALTTSMNRLSSRLRDGLPISIADLGGSCSLSLKCGGPTYIDKVADSLRAAFPLTTVHAYNPSLDSSGSVWAALHMDSLIPNTTDLVLWDFTVNDYQPDPLQVASRNLSLSIARKQKFELFLHRATALNPNIVVGVISLWRNSAGQNCWPCPEDAQLYTEVLSVAQQYPSIPIFTIDARALAQHLSWSQSDMLHDYHHPTTLMHSLIGSAILAEMMGSVATSSVSGVVTQTAPHISKHPASDFMAMLWDRHRSLQSFMYSEGASVLSHDIMALHPGQSTFNAGAANEYSVPIPSCSSSATFLEFSFVSNRPDSQVHFVGLNIPDFNTSRVCIDDPELFVSWNGVTMEMVTCNQFYEWNASIMIDTNTKQPQKWFALHTGASAASHLAVDIRVCSTKQGYLGSVICL